MQLPPVDKPESGYCFNGGEYDTIQKNSYFCILSDNIKRVHLSTHTKDGVKYIENMKKTRRILLIIQYIYVHY